VALASWAVRTRRLDPFSPLAKSLRNFTDPMIKPVEGWVVRSGGPPQSAGWWVFGIALIGGIIVLTRAGWLRAQLALASSATMTPIGLLKLVIYYAGQLVMLAIIVRVIGTWLGAGRYSPWTRWSYFLSDWLIEPLRKVIPPLGPIDITPIVAWFLLQIGLRLVLGFL
jgi:YggT family protein